MDAIGSGNQARRYQGIGGPINMADHGNTYDFHLFHSWGGSGIDPRNTFARDWFAEYIETHNIRAFEQNDGHWLIDEREAMDIARDIADAGFSFPNAELVEAFA
jgi:hypothetical protein